MALARLIEPTSKADTIRVLDGIAAPHPSLRTLFRSLHRCHDLNYKDTLAKTMLAYRSRSVGLGAMIMYDVTTLLCRCRHNNVVTSYITNDARPAVAAR